MALWYLLLALGLAGCATSGKHTTVVLPTREVFIAHLGGDFPPYATEQVKSALQRCGMTVVTMPTTNSLICSSHVSVAYSGAASVRLTKDGITYAWGRSTNPGWGTLIAHDAVKDSLMLRALQSFEEQLAFVVAWSDRPLAGRQLPNSLTH